MSDPLPSHPHPSTDPQVEAVPGPGPGGDAVAVVVRRWLEFRHPWLAEIDPASLRRMALTFGAVVAVAVASALWWLTASSDPPDPDLPMANPGGEAAAFGAAPVVFEIVVHVAGAVAHPGVYVLADGARVADAIARAGGAIDGAELDRLNLAAALRDGAQVFVPVNGEPIPVAASDASGGGLGLVDLNTATAAELEALPGIGPATAAKIVAWRDDHGPFASVEALTEVPGIGPAKLAALRDLVTV